MMWYPNCSFTMNKTVHKIDQAISHYLPAYALDLGARLTGKRVKWVRSLERIFSEFFVFLVISQKEELRRFYGKLFFYAWIIGAFVWSCTSCHFLFGFLYDSPMAIRQWESHPPAGLPVRIWQTYFLLWRTPNQLGFLHRDLRHRRSAIHSER